MDSYSFLKAQCDPETSKYMETIRAKLRECVLAHSKSCEGGIEECDCECVCQVNFTPVPSYQRLLIHELAKRHLMESKSQGEEPNRFVVVRCTPCSIVWEEETGIDPYSATSTLIERLKGGDGGMGQQAGEEGEGEGDVDDWEELCVEPHGQDSKEQDPNTISTDSTVKRVPQIHEDEDPTPKIVKSRGRGAQKYRAPSSSSSSSLNWGTREREREREKEKSPPPHPPDNDNDVYTNIVELYDFDHTAKTADICGVLHEGGWEMLEREREREENESETTYKMKWVDDNTVLLIFTSKKSAESVVEYVTSSRGRLRSKSKFSLKLNARLLSKNNPNPNLRRIEYTFAFETETGSSGKSSVVSRPRPETRPTVARRMIASALNVKLSRDEQTVGAGEVRELRKKREERRREKEREKEEARKMKEEVWGD